jgi:hypothetical protein
VTDASPLKSWRVQPIVDPGISGARILPSYAEEDSVSSAFVQLEHLRSCWVVQC